MKSSLFSLALAVGAGWKSSDWRIDAAYTIGLGEQTVGTSGYRAGEYSASQLKVAVHSLGISANKGF